MPTEKRNHGISVALTMAEREELELAADMDERPLGQWIRRVALQAARMEPPPAQPSVMVAPAAVMPPTPAPIVAPAAAAPVAASPVPGHRPTPLTDEAVAQGAIPPVIVAQATKPAWGGRPPKTCWKEPAPPRWERDNPYEGEPLDAEGKPLKGAELLRFYKDQKKAIMAADGGGGSGGASSSKQDQGGDDE